MSDSFITEAGGDPMPTPGVVVRWRPLCEAAEPDRWEAYTGAWEGPDDSVWHLSLMRAYGDSGWRCQALSEGASVSRWHKSREGAALLVCEAIAVLSAQPAGDANAPTVRMWSALRFRRVGEASDLWRESMGQALQAQRAEDWDAVAEWAQCLDDMASMLTSVYVGEGLTTLRDRACSELRAYQSAELERRVAEVDAAREGGGDGDR